MSKMTPCSLQDFALATTSLDVGSSLMGFSLMQSPKSTVALQANSSQLVCSPVPLTRRTFASFSGFDIRPGMDADAPGRELCRPGAGPVRLRLEERNTAAHEWIRLLKCFRLLPRHSRISSEDYRTPAALRLQWFPWADAFVPLQSQRILVAALLEHVRETDGSFIEYGQTLHSVYVQKATAIGHARWIVESISNQLWGVNVTPSFFEIEGDCPVPPIWVDSIADAPSFVPAEQVLINYVGNADICPLSFGELLFWKVSCLKNRSGESNTTKVEFNFSSNENIELLDLRGGSWVEVMYGTKYMGGLMQPAPQLRDVPSHICEHHSAGKFYQFSEEFGALIHTDCQSVLESVKILQELQTSFHLGSQKILYPSAAFLNPKTQLVPCSQWHTVDFFNCLNTPTTIFTGVEDTALSEFDQTGLIAYVTRWSLVSLYCCKKGMTLPTIGGIALSSASEENFEIDTQGILEACVLANELPLSLATKFWLFPTAFVGKLLSGTNLQLAQAWWVSATLSQIAEFVLSHSTGSPVLNVTQIRSAVSVQSSGLECQIVTMWNNYCQPGSLSIDWANWSEQLLSNGSYDYLSLMAGLGDEDSAEGAFIIEKSITGQQFPYDPISDAAIAEDLDISKTVQRMPRWADDCVGLVYAAWRHLVVFFHRRCMWGRNVHIGTVWKSVERRNPTWSCLVSALVECLDAPWNMKTVSFLGIAQVLANELGTYTLANLILSSMAIYGEIRATGSHACITAHLSSSGGLPVITSVNASPVVENRYLRKTERDIWIAVTPRQWLGPFRQVSDNVLHGESTRLTRPEVIVVQDSQPIPFSRSKSKVQLWKVGADPLFLEDFAKLAIRQLKLTVYCGETIRGIQVPHSSLLLVGDKEILKNAQIAAEIGFDVKLVRGKVSGRYVPATFGKMVSSQRALENVIENILRRRGEDPSSRASASAIIIYKVLFGDLRVAGSSVRKAWVPQECLASFSDGFTLNHAVSVAGRTRGKRAANSLKIGITATSSLDLEHEELAPGSSATDPAPLAIASAKVTRYSTGTSPISTWPSVRYPGFLF